MKDTLFNICIYMHINQLDAQILVIILYFLLGVPHVFDFLLVHHQEQLYKLYIAYTGICRYHTCGCCVFIGITPNKIKFRRKMVKETGSLDSYSNT
jgi:hypothetical protein